MKIIETLSPWIRTIDEPLDVNLEIPHIAYAEIKKAAPKILVFTHPVDKALGKTYDMPVVMNIFANDAVVETIFGTTPDAIAAKVQKALKLKPPKSLSDKLETFKFLFDLRNVFPKRLKSAGECQAREIASLSELPILKTWSEDGGKFITMGQVYTQSLDGEIHNVGMYRLQVYDDKRLGMHWQIHKDSNHLFHQYKKAGRKMPVSVAIGGDPLYTWCGTAPLPHGIFELMLYGFVRNKPARLVKCKTNPIHVPEDADIVIEGWVDPEVTEIEGMFGDHTGYYTLKEPYPVLEVSRITAKNDPVFYATVVGKPPLEDKYMGLPTERIFLPLLQTQAPDLKDYKMPENGVFHNLILCKIAPQYPGHSLQIMHALWGVGQMSFVKHALFVDESAPELGDYEALTKHILDRLSPEAVTITTGIVDALDHSASRPLIGGKLGIDATGSVVERTIDLLDDAALLKKVKTIDSDVVALKQYMTQSANPVTVIQYEKKRPARELFEALKPLSGHIAIAVFVDTRQNDVNNPYMLVWRVTNNIDAQRDVWLEEMIGVDGTNKDPMDGFTREWPGDVVCDADVFADLRARGLIDLDDETVDRYQLVGESK
ncbi:menaquinone biosynthesis decarboxylase [Sulfurimonas sp. HSL-3221]|uniref:menaquinone biosynthesis decarboxylase n=1 Tax=Sulfurimonadaceae TaxID=2771471 RepID=UPI001E3B4EBE|nr:menaquinone biosynthesis decarboxylase [Sulfurimonas sp. HSL-3221]UFS62611.1 menaquinone biosynthesis decarboxylase [Sulfurimonas sp. HSL-3221]